jgi:hypothetical protein
MHEWLQAPVISKTAVAGNIEGAGMDEGDIKELPYCVIALLPYC